MTGYTDIIRQWATDTRRAGILSNADGTGEVGLDSKEAGSRLAARFTLKVELELVTDVRYQVFGCGFSMAACAVAADMSMGYTLDDLQRIDAGRIGDALKGLPAERSYCADLAVEALQAAVKSARNDRQMVQANVQSEAEHGPDVTSEDPVYSALINSPKPEGITGEDRHLFACLLAIAVQESHNFSSVLGLANSDIAIVLKRYFPAIDQDFLSQSAIPEIASLPEYSEEVLSILLSHVPTESGTHDLLTSVWLCYILAARAARPGHLWVAMGLFERPQLTDTIRRHLPSLAEANKQNMRWKRYLFKQVCDLNGGVMCKAPNCGVCSDYALCFAEE